MIEQHIELVVPLDLSLYCCVFIFVLRIYSNREDGVVSLMIEYMDGGSLQDIVDQGGCDDEPTLANIAVQALKGLLFLHENYQIHRDLKPDTYICTNILFTVQ